ncbi:hypothetical protein [Paenibacillus lentus]|uniref:hypothetical protein n=1 Tax=Paenibacillus lentus TaxID=1338368 RepID=UPI0013DDBAA9|nr:hypothetical protein [Paenibacillus lentus]
MAGGIRLYGYVDDPIIWVDVFGLKKNGGGKGGKQTRCSAGDTDDYGEWLFNKRARLLKFSGGWNNE